MAKRKIIKEETSSDSGGNSDSEHQNSNAATLSDHPPPPITPRRSKRGIRSKPSADNQLKLKKRALRFASFSPSPEEKSPKKPRSANAKPPTTPNLTKRPTLGSPIVLIQTKKKISRTIEETEDEEDSNDEDEDDEDEDIDIDEEDDEDEDIDVDEEDDSMNDFLDQEAEEEDSSEEDKSTYSKSKNAKKKAENVNPKRQKIVDAAIKQASKSKTTSNSKKTPVLKDTQVYLEDLTKDPIERRPSLQTCQVFDRDLVDGFLAKTYKGLPKLPSGYTNNRYLPAGEAQQPMMYVSELLPALTKISKKYLLDLFTFVSDKGTSTVNLSRIEPCDLIAKKPESGSMYPLVTLRNQKTPALCLSVISVDEDFTRDPKDINGSPYKILTGVIQTMEYERLIACLCLIYKVSGIKTVMSNNRWSFSSRPGNSNNRLQNSYNHAGPSYLGGSKKLSPANAHQSQFKNSKWKLGYTFDEDIPILDGRSLQIEIPNGLRKVAEDLPAFQGNIPSGSLTLVGYTVLGYNSKKSPDELTIGTNICWAVVLATPKV